MRPNEEGTGFEEGPHGMNGEEGGWGDSDGFFDVCEGDEEGNRGLVDVLWLGDSGGGRWERTSNTL